MRHSIKYFVIFLWLITFCIPNAYAARTVAGESDARPDEVAAVVRVEGDRPVCVRYADLPGFRTDSSLPVCPDSGPLGEQTEAALNLAKLGKNAQTRTAFLPWIAAFVGGCIYGAGTVALARRGFDHIQGGREAIPTTLGAAGTQIIAITAGYGGWLALAPLDKAAVMFSMPSAGLMPLALAGDLACAGGVTYLIYSLRGN